MHAPTRLITAVPLLPLNEMAQLSLQPLLDVTLALLLQADSLQRCTARGNICASLVRCVVLVLSCVCCDAVYCAITRLM